MDSSALLKQAIEITDAMQQKADEALWEELVEMEQQREQLLQQALPLAPSDNANEQLRSLIVTLADKNSQLEQVCNQAKQEIQTHLQTLNKNKKAVSAYQSR